MRNLILIISIFLCGCAIQGEKWELREGKMVLVEILVGKGLGFETYEPGKKVSKKEPLKVPDLNYHK